MLFTTGAIGSGFSLNYFSDPADVVTGYPLSNAENDTMWTFGAVKFYNYTLPSPLSLAGSKGSFYRQLATATKVLAIIKPMPIDFTLTGTIFYRFQVVNGVPANDDPGGTLFDSGWLFDGATTGYNSRFNSNFYCVLPTLMGGSGERVIFSLFHQFNQSSPRYMKFAFASGFRAYEPEFCASYGSRLSLIDGTAKSVAESGATLFGPKKRLRRSLALNMEKMPRDELYNDLLEQVVYTTGYSGNFIAILEPDNHETYMHSAIFGSLREDRFDAEFNSWERFNSSINIDESI